MLLAPALVRAQSQTYATVYSFAAMNADGQTNPDGAHPGAALTPGSGGVLYGTARDGGSGGTGTVFKLMPPAALTTLYAFAALNPDGRHNQHGAHPNAALTVGANGKLYGTTVTGGSGGTGTVFQITPKGTLTTLHNFAPIPAGKTANADGAHPNASVVFGSDGALYGTTSDGGAGGTGTVFRLTLSGALTTLHAFGKLTAPTSAYNSDGAFPYCALVQGTDGLFYGMTSLGTGGGNGTLFKVSASGVFATVHAFSAYTVDGACGAGLLLSRDGSFYGTTFYGGVNGAGEMLQLTASGTLNALYSFPLLDFQNFNTDGAYPGPLFEASDGALYGTTCAGAASGYGTVFRLSKSGALTTLHAFAPPDGYEALGGLCQTSNGLLYGATARGGAGDTGTLYRLSAPVSVAAPGQSAAPQRF